MPKYVSAKPGLRNSVIYTDSGGGQWAFKGGTRTWRNQNPGDLVTGKVSQRNGAIGKAGGFAIFPDCETGHQALIDSLESVHGNEDIPTLMRSYAPSSENDTKKYIAFVRKQTGVTGNKKVKDFSAVEFKKLWQAIEKMEGWVEGTVSSATSKAKVTGVRKNKKGTIQSYQIEGYGWVSKSEAIALTLAGKVDTVVATSSAGTKFLRARPNSKTSDNLEALG